MTQTLLFIRRNYELLKQNLIFLTVQNYVIVVEHLKYLHNDDLQLTLGIYKNIWINSKGIE